MAPDVTRRIFIRDFRLQVSIGIHDFEKEGPQTVVVNIDLLLGPQDKAHNDRIANVLNYDVVHDGIKALAGSRHFNLQETLVDAITSNRVYREGRSYEAAARELDEWSNQQFDPKVVEAFHRVPKGDWEELRRRSVMREPNEDVPKGDAD